MDPERWKQIEEVYHAAGEVAPAERDGYLARVCGGDASLEAEVRSLLAYDEQRTGPLDPFTQTIAYDEPPKHRLPAGTMLGPYRIEGVLGAGGMGEVFRATDTRLDRTVAIKVLPANRVADAVAKRRFLQEARAVSALNSPYIVTLHDIAAADGIDFLVLEFVKGSSLDRVMDGKALREADALKYGEQTALALAAAHGAGVVHRDIKPANIMVTNEGQIKVLDFGLAKLTAKPLAALQQASAGATSATAQGAIVGTVAYMSPEQAAGKETGPGTDIFSLGVVIHEMLTGRNPFRRDSAISTMAAVINDPCPELPDAAPELAEILGKALAKLPSERYQHAGDLALDLRRFSKQAGAGSLPSRRREALSRPSRLPWIAAGAFAIACAAGLTWWVLRAPEWVNPLEGAQFTRLTDFEGTKLDAALSPDGKLVAFLTNRDGPFDAFIGQVGIGTFRNVTGGRYPELLHEGVKSLGFTADGTSMWLRISVSDPMRLRESGQSRGIYTLPVLGGELQRILERAVGAAWSPDGSRIAYSDPLPGDPVFVADRQGMHPKQILIGQPGGHNHEVSWSRDGKWIYLVRGFRNQVMDVWRVPSEGGAPVRLTFQNAKLGQPVELNDRLVLYTGTEARGSGSSLYALDPRSGKRAGPIWASRRSYRSRRATVRTAR